MSKFLTLSLSAIACGGILAGCSSSSSPAPTTTLPSSPLLSKSGTTIVALSNATMLAKGSVDVTQTQKADGLSVTVELNSGRTSAVERYTGAVGKGTVTFVGGKLYVVGDTTFLKSQFATGSNYASWAGVAIEVPRTDPNYANLAQGLLLPAFLTVSSPIAPLRVVGVARFHGTAAVKVNGAINTRYANGATGTLSYYYGLHAPILPIGATGKLLDGTLTGTTVITFKSFGQPVQAVAPSHPFLASSTTLG